MHRLLRRAIRESGLEPSPSAGSITFFAALAGWESEPGLVACADIDLLATDDMASVVAAAMSGRDDEAIVQLEKLLLQKHAFTNVANIDTIGLHEVASMIRGLAPILRPRMQPGWLEFATLLAQAVNQLDNAVMEGPALDRITSMRP